MRPISLICTVLAAMALLGCANQSNERGACAVYRSFFEQLPAPGMQAFYAITQPNILALHGSRIEPPTRFERGAGLMEPDPNAPPESFDADTASYYDQLHSEPSINLSTCFPERTPRFVQPSDDVLLQLDQPNSDILSIWSLSPVAFSPDGQRALIVGGMSCGGLCGGGAYYLFEKSGEEWALMGHRDLWVS